MGPLLLHKDASYKTYKFFLQHIATELDTEVDSLELRISKLVEFGSDDEKALTKAIEHVFPEANRYLCSKHLKDNVRHHLQNKIGMDRPEREVIVDAIFNTGTGLVSVDTSFEFEEKSENLIQRISKYPEFQRYYESRLKQKIQENVFHPQRNQSAKSWTNNNAESINNIIKLSTDWKPQNTHDLVGRLYNITKLHFLDYRSALSDRGNYRLVDTLRRKYFVPEAIWRCKDDSKKEDIFETFLMGRKKTAATLVSSSDGKYHVPQKAVGTAKKPGQRVRPVNERARKR